MANLTDNPIFELGIYQLELGDPVIGGPGGMSNRQSQELANRTAYLKQHVDAMETANFAPKNSPVFTGNPTAPTPQQFDNDTSMATTEFVQRTLGNMRGYGTFSANTVLSVADIGKYIVGMTSGMTLTLPDATLLPAGSRFYIQAAGGATNGVTIVSVNGNFSGTGGMGAATSFVLNPGTSCELINNGANWIVTGGAGAASLASPGYQKLSSGLIIQWGASVFTGAGATITFPIAFPIGPFHVYVSDNDIAAVGTVFATGSMTTTTFVGKTNGITEGAAWFAIGR